MAESSFTNFFNNSQSFGLNVVKSHERTLNQAGKTLENVTGGVFEPLFTYLEENENVFSGDITKELNKNYAANFNITMAMNLADEKINGKSTFNTQF